MAGLNSGELLSREPLALNDAREIMERFQTLRRVVPLTRRRRTSTRLVKLVLAGLASVLALLVSPGPAGAASPGGLATPPSQREHVGQRIVKPATLNTPDDCDTVKNKIKNHEVNGNRPVACLSLQSAAGQMSTNSVVPAPDWCTVNQVIITRHEACGLFTLHIDVLQVPTGDVVGGMDIGQLGYMFAEADFIDWQYQATQTFSNIWGAAVGTTVTGNGWCTGDCVTISQEWPTLVATESTVWEGYVDGESTKFQPGEVGTGSLDAETTFTNPAWENPLTNSGATPDVRCDNALPGRGAGCVVPQVAPEIFYELNGPYPELAAHIRDAQASGLPGGTTDRPLHRLTDQSLIDLNRSVSCPASQPPPAGQSCDEYPFASSWEGAATGVDGYSTRMIDADQNTQGGVALGTFYADERVIEHDAFLVTVV